MALASLHAGEILDEAALPLRYAGFSPCFRREAGAAGKDTRGIFRVHQFDKVEMFSFVDRRTSRPRSTSACSRSRRRSSATLGIPYRVVNIAVDRPRRVRGQEVRHRGVAARAGALPRADLHARTPPTSRPAAWTSATAPTAAGGTAHVATLNGTAVAVGRTIIALLENGQRDDGTVVLPEVLRPYGAPELISAG